jgi:ATP-binding cassette, subfamily F, member 3
VSILRFAGVTREVGTLRILDGLDAAVPAGTRIGLVGPNGAGKTTLLRLAAGLDEPDEGRVERKRDLHIALLAQEAGLEPGFAAVADLRRYVRSGATRLEALERELRALEEQGGEAVQSAAYADRQHRFETLGGYALDQHVDEALSGLGFAKEAWGRPPAMLSGGEQTRAALARMVIADPDLLLLDEPTNHLDLAALEWLEAALVARSGALIVASHDRAFLDAVPERIWELRDRRLTGFRGGYSAYAVQREERDARLRREAEARAGEIAREERLIATYRSHRKYGKMHEHEARLARLEPVAEHRDGRRLRMPTGSLAGAAVHSGDVALRLRDAVAGLAGRRIVGVPRLEVRRGERIGIVGPNGVGKTTLLRAIAGDLSLVDGELRLDRRVEIGYLSQLRTAQLAGETVLDALLGRVAVTQGEARSHLARFLFSGEDVFKSVGVLSGGERSRLELALLGVLPANLLLLDEPTNHLDIPAREALELFLRETPATVILVSHDRRLLDAACDRLLVIAPLAGHDTEAVALPFEGGYRAWHTAQSSGAWDAAAELARLHQAAGPVTAAVARPGGWAEAGGRAAAGCASGGPQPRRPLGTGGEAGAPTERAVRREVRPRVGAVRSGAAGGRGSAAKLSKDAYRRARSTVDGDLTRLGLRRGQIELALTDPSVQSNYVELRRLTSELADVETALGAAEDAWLSLEERAPR